MKFESLHFFREFRARRTAFITVVALLFGVAAIPRLWKLENESLWFDEAVTAGYTHGSVGEAYRANTADATPPLYFAGLTLWRKIAGFDDAALRAYGGIWSLLGGFVIFVIVLQAGGRSASILALLLFAVAPLDVSFAREARPYSQANTMTALATWIWLQWFIGRNGLKRGPLISILYGASAGVAILSHYLAGLVIAAHVLIGLPILVKGKCRREVVQVIVGMIVCVVVVVPWAWFVWRMQGALILRNVQWMPQPKVRDMASFFFRDFAYGTSLKWHWLGGAFAGALASLVVIAVRESNSRGKAGKNRPNSPVRLLIALVFLPVVLAAVSSLVLGRHVYYPGRFSLFCLPPFIAAVCLMANSWQARAALVALAIVMMAGLYAQFESAQKPDWRGFARLWENSGRLPRVLFYPHYNKAAANHYLNGQLRTYYPEDFNMDIQQHVAVKVWLVQQKDFALPLQPLEIEMRQRVLSRGTAREIDAPRGLEVTEVQFPGGSGP